MLITRTTNTMSGSFVALHVVGINHQEVARCYLSEHPGSFYMDITGRGRDEVAARRNLADKIAIEVRRLEANVGRRPFQENRLRILRTFV